MWNKFLLTNSYKIGVQILVIPLVVIIILFSNKSFV
jgi:hypothetical protein